MLIEADARRFISDAIETERELQSLEIREKAKGRILLDFDEYHKKRDKLAKQISQLNAVANSEGKGREDLEIDILLSAEGIIRRISPDQSKAVRSLAEQIRTSFMNIRYLLRKYEQNIEIVDPQLKNNPELVEALVAYETSWEKGKAYFLNGKTCSQLIHFSQIIEGTAEKYKEFQEQIECRDADIFVSIPCLLILKSLEDNDKGICKYFLPHLDDPNDKLGKIYHEIKTVYAEECKKHNYYEYYNYVERLVLNIGVQDQTFKHKTQIETMMQKITQLSIELQRSKPTEWNNLMDVLLGND
jgi:Fe2+ transport system protein B